MPTLEPSYSQHSSILLGLYSYASHTCNAYSTVPGQKSSNKCKNAQPHSRVRYLLRRHWKHLLTCGLRYVVLRILWRH